MIRSTSEAAVLGTSCGLASELLHFQRELDHGLRHRDGLVVTSRTVRGEVRGQQRAPIGVVALA